MKKKSQNEFASEADRVDDSVDEFCKHICMSRGCYYVRGLLYGQHIIRIVAFFVGHPTNLCSLGMIHYDPFKFSEGGIELDVLKSEISEACSAERIAYFKGEQQ